MHTRVGVPARVPVLYLKEVWGSAKALPDLILVFHHSFSLSVLCNHQHPYDHLPASSTHKHRNRCDSEVQTSEVCPNFVFRKQTPAQAMPPHLLRSSPLWSTWGRSVTYPIFPRTSMSFPTPFLCYKAQVRLIHELQVIFFPLFAFPLLLEYHPQLHRVTKILVI